MRGWGREAVSMNFFSKLVSVIIQLYVKFHSLQFGSHVANTKNRFC